MAYTVPNQTEPIEVVVDIATQVPTLMPGILFMLWLVVAGAGFYSQQRRVGKGNLPMWLAVSSFITTSSAFMLFLYNGLISLSTLVICVSVTMLSALWFFFSNTDNTSSDF